MKNFTRTFCYVILLLVSLAILGCQSTQSCNQAEPLPQSLVIASDQMDIAWDETLEVLSEHYFTPDRQDRREGVIVTFPSLSKQWFEFWRDDAQGCYNVAESSINSIRRIATITFAAEGKNVVISAKVAVQRKNQPQRQITTSSGSFQVFRDRTPLVVTGQNTEKVDVVSWVDIGEDVRQANYLLERIERRLPESTWMTDNCEVAVEAENARPVE